MDMNTKRSAVKNGLEKWIEWEKDVKHFLSEMHNELINNNEVALALRLE